MRPVSADAPKVVWPANGFAFAAKKSIICESKLYDHGVLDGNDILFLCAIYGEFELAMERLKHNEMQRRHYLEWARRAQKSFGGNLGIFLERSTICGMGIYPIGTIWVGMSYMTGFDPYRDIQQAPNGAWLWSDPQSELARNVREYFRSRKEDG